MKERIAGIMGAMPEETDAVVKLLTGAKQSTHAGRIYHEGYIKQVKTVVVVSGWGKVAAAATASTLVHLFHITELVFTGVAGAIDPCLKIGDIVIASRLLQHDMDARPFIPQYEIPLLKKTYFECAAQQLSIARTAVHDFLQRHILYPLIGEPVLEQFHIVSPKLYIGDIASGDQFFADETKKQQLHAALPAVLCVEMEGAAVAQVCFENEIPFTVIRTVSDAAGEGSHIDFAAFIEKIAGTYSAAIIQNIFR
jgi:adenosylhomocysteine nucleosidase